MTLLSSILPNFVGHTICSQQFNLRLLEVLGTGAYGVVYLAHNTTPGRGDYPAFYAVKCLLKYEEGSQLAANQEREILYHKLVSHHPNIITLHEVIHEEHFTFLVMDFCLGGDLFSAITERQIYHRNDIAIKHTFLQLLDAIEFCQSKQVYHRDLKPENILYSADDGQVCVTDFGLSTRADVSTTFGCGSSCYMSPGQSFYYPVVFQRFMNSALQQNVWASLPLGCPSPPPSRIYGLWGSFSSIWSLVVIHGISPLQLRTKDFASFFKKEHLTFKDPFPYLKTPPDYSYPFWSLTQQRGSRFHNFANP